MGNWKITKPDFRIIRRELDKIYGKKSTEKEARADRIGQKLSVTYVDLLYKSSIDTLVLKAISKKQDIARVLVESFLGGEYE